MVVAEQAGHRPGALSRAASAAVGALALALALWLAAHHPLSAPLALLATLAGTLVLALWPVLMPALLPALLPFLGLAPWTGWITAEEFDLLVLAAAAGGHLRWALRPWPVLPPRWRLGQLLAGLLLALWTLSVAVSAWRGVADAGGWDPGWWQAYRGPMNALRLAKPTLGLLLLWPLWLRLQAAPAQQAPQRLLLGMALGLGGTALACVWERWLFPGLSNFSTDYRTTALFWEMHVGGAALDGFLALSLPFAVMLCLVAPGRRMWTLGAACTLLGAYAGFTAFSRILLVALPLGVGWALVQHGLTRPAGAAAGAAPPGPATAPRQALLAAAVLLVATLAGAAAMFMAAGYRGMAAWLGNALLWLVLGPQLHRLRRGEWLAAAALALALGPALVLGALQLPKAIYLLDAVVVLASLGLALAARGRSAWLALALAGAGIALVCSAGVARYWGDALALGRSAVPLVLMALALAATGALRRPPWPADLRWQGGVAMAMAVVAVGVGIFVGGDYMSGRLGQTGGEQQFRGQHWAAALARRGDDTASRWLGAGLGRFADHYATDPPTPKDRPGDIRLVAEGDGLAMHLVAGTHMMGWGELLRLSQRITRPVGLTTLQLQVRSAVPQHLHAEVCIKHLLYDNGCQMGELGVPATGDRWVTVTLPLQDTPLPADPWWASRTTVFSIGTETSTGVVALRRLQLTDAQGTPLLHNGDFADGGARWFFSSDRHHMPWHAKNMVVHLLVEQGWLGLLALVAMTLVAFARLLGPARGHLLAAPLAGGLAGWWVVSGIDSLLDMPRVALPFLLLTMVALALPRTGTRAPAR